MTIYTFGGSPVDATAAASSIAKYARCDEEQTFILIQKILDFGLGQFKYCLDGRKLILKDGWREVI